MASLLNDKQEKLIRTAIEKGGVDQEMALDIYTHQPSVSKALSHLTELGLLTKEEAPPRSRKQSVWMPTDKAYVLVAPSKTPDNNVNSSSADNMGGYAVQQSD